MSSAIPLSDYCNAPAHSSNAPGGALANCDRSRSAQKSSSFKKWLFRLIQIVLFITTLLSLAPLLADHTSDAVSPTAAVDEVLTPEILEPVIEVLEEHYEQETTEDHACPVEEALQPAEASEVIVEQEENETPIAEDDLSQVEVVTTPSNPGHESDQQEEHAQPVFNTLTVVHLLLAGCSSLFVLYPAILLYKRKQNPSKRKRLVRPPRQNPSQQSPSPKRKEIWTSPSSFTRRAVEQRDRLVFADDLPSPPSPTEPEAEPTHHFDVFLLGSYVCVRVRSYEFNRRLT